MPRTTEQLLERAATAKRESRYLDFKAAFDPADAGEWVELIKDFVAMSNSGGGVIVVGAANDGKPSRADVKPVLRLDPATITDKVERYTGEHFADFEIHSVKRGRATLAAITVGAAPTPIAFTRVGTYDVTQPGEKQKQKTAFSKGTVYVRHGAKSEPATSIDLRDIIERRLDEVREAWLGDIRKVVSAPPGSEVAVISRGAADESGAPTNIRLTNEPGAPVYGKLAPDQTHPYRRMDALAAINERLPKSVRQVNTHDIQAVRSVHGIHETTHPEWIHQPKFASRQYSEGFVDWFVEQHASNDRFLDDARDAYYDMQYGG